MKKIAMKKIGRRNLKMTLNLNCAFNHFLCKNMFIFKFDHTFNLYTLIRFRLVLIAINSIDNIFLVKNKVFNHFVEFFRVFLMEILAQIFEQM